MPIPPIHWLNCRQIIIERSTAAKSVRMLPPEVVIPDMASKRASTGWSSWDSPESTYGSDTAPAASSHVSETTRNPSRTPTCSFPCENRSRPSPTAAVIAPAATNGQGVSEWPSAIAIGKRNASEKYLRSAPTRLRAAPTSTPTTRRRRPTGELTGPSRPPARGSTP